MFELEIEREKKICTDAIVVRGERFTSLQSICATEGLHPFYITFFVAHADWWIYELNLERSGDVRFDFNAPSVSPLLKETDKVLRETVRFSYDELLSTIDVAVKVRLNFLCRPRTTLTWFIFRGEPTKPINEIWLRLNYFSEYSYLAEGFRQWAQANYTVHPSHELLSVVEFDTLIADIDNATILELSPYQFTDLLEPVYEFFSQAGKLPENSAVPIEALIIFLDDKGVDLIAKELERMYYDEHIDRLTRNDFLEVVTKIVSELEGNDTSVLSGFQHEESDKQDYDEVAEKDTVEQKDTIIQQIEPAQDTLESKERFAELEETDSSFLGMVHTFSVDEDYVSVDNEGSAELYMAEFVGTAESIVTTGENDANEEAVKDNSDKGIEDLAPEAELPVAPEQAIESDVLNEEVSDEIVSEGVEETAEVSEKVETTSESNEENEVPVIIEAIKEESETSEESETIIDEYETVLPDITKQAEDIGGETPSVESTEQVIAEVLTDEKSESDTITPFNAEVYSLTEQQPSRGYIPSLSSKIDAGKKESFIKKMFHKDNELFEIFVKEIDKTYSWKEAAAAIDRFYVRHNIKDSGALAKELRTIIQKRYVR